MIQHLWHKSVSRKHSYIPIFCLILLELQMLCTQLFGLSEDDTFIKSYLLIRILIAYCVFLSVMLKLDQ